MNTKVSMGIFALALTLSVYAQAQQPMEFPGEYQIVVVDKTDAGKAFLCTAKNQLVAEHSTAGIKWKFENVGSVGSGDEKRSLFHISEAGRYLILEDGKPVLSDEGKPNPDAHRWQVVLDGEGVYSIHYSDDEDKGANVLSIFSKDSGATVEKSQTAIGLAYEVVLERHNAGGEGKDHQQWEIRKRED